MPATEWKDAQHTAEPFGQAAHPRGSDVLLPAMGAASESHLPMIINLLDLDNTLTSLVSRFVRPITCLAESGRSHRATTHYECEQVIVMGKTSHISVAEIRDAIFGVQGRRPRVDAAPPGHSSPDVFASIFPL
jgi:hypothetical protein